MRFIKITALIALFIIGVVLLSGCDTPTASNTQRDVSATIAGADNLAKNQPTPTDIQYSLERYNLIRRAYWVNGQRERARTLPCAIADIPMGHIVLVTESGSVVGKFIVEGKVSSLNSFLTPDSEYFELVYGGSLSQTNEWLADVDGSYGENDNGIFFFTPDGKYVEWTGVYLYSDIPLEVETPVVTYRESVS